MNYKTMVETAGKVAGAYAFETSYANAPQANTVDMDSTMTVKVLSETFGMDEEVVENDILWIQDEEYNRLVRLAKEAEMKLCQAVLRK